MTGRKNLENDLNQLTGAWETPNQSLRKFELLVRIKLPARIKTDTIQKQVTGSRICTTVILIIRI